MGLPDMKRFRDLANEDAEFLIAARFWNCRMKLAMESFDCVLTIEDGRIASLNSAPSESDEWDILISGPAEDWERLCEPVPRPFYQDIFAAAVYHGFSYDGDLESMYAYYPALRRMVELMRECAAAGV